MQSWVRVSWKGVASCADRIVVNAAPFRPVMLSHSASTGHLPLRKSRPPRRKPPTHPEAVPNCRLHADGGGFETAEASPPASSPGELDSFRQDCWPRNLTASVERPWNQDWQVIPCRKHRTLKTGAVEPADTGQPAGSCVHPSPRAPRELQRRAGGRGLLQRSAPPPRLLGFDCWKVGTRRDSFHLPAGCPWVSAMSANSFRRLPNRALNPTGLLPTRKPSRRVRFAPAARCGVSAPSASGLRCARGLARLR